MENLDHIVQQCRSELDQAHQRISILEKLLDEQREFEKMLRRNEERYRDLTENTSDWIWELDEHFRYTYASPKVYDMLGYTPDEVLGKMPTDFMTPGEITIHGPFFEKLTKEPHAFQGLENENRHKDGSVRFLETSAVPIYDRQGRFSGYRGIDRDITGRKLAERAFQKSEERYRNFLENIEDACFETDLKGNTIYANQAAIRRTGHTQTGMNGVGYRKFTNPREAQRIFKIFNDIYRTGPPGIIRDYEMHDEDGRIRFVDMAVSLMTDDTGKPVGFRGISRDVTERKREHEQLERYRRFVESVEDACFEFDLNGACTFCNASACRTLGYTRDEFMGLNFRQRHANRETADRIAAIVKNIYHRKILHDHYESEMMRKDGSIVVMEMVVSPIFDHQENVVGFRGIGRDITEKKKEQAELERYRDFMENIADGCFENDLAGSLTYVNEIATQRLGLTREQAVGMNNRQYSRPEEAERISRIFAEIYRTGKPALIDNCEIFNRKGESLFLDMSASLIRDARGKPVGFRGTTRDVTEKKIIQDALKESEANYRLLIENSPIGILVYSSDGRIIMSNSRARQLLEASEDLLLNTRANDAGWTLLRVDGSPIAPSEHPIYQAIAKNTPINDLLLGIIRPESGTLAWVLANAQPQWNKEGRLDRVIVSLIDITVRRKALEALAQSEAKYRFLTEKMSDIVWTTDTDLNITYISPSVQAALGYSQEEMMEQNTDHFMTAESFARLTDMIKKGVQQDQSTSEKPERSISYETAYYHKNGGIIWFHNVASSIRDDSGKLIGFHGVSRDITGQKQAAAEREKLIEDLKQALADVKTLSGMLPICSHCKKIRDDSGYWNQLEGYITMHSDALFSHCICPDCASKLYSDYLPKKTP